MAARRVGTNLAAVRSTIAALRTAGRLEQVDDAVVTAAESLALAVDAIPVDARLWGQYQAALRQLQSVGVYDGDDDEIGALVAALRGDAEVVDPED